MDVGDTAPDFELPDQDGTPRRLFVELAKGPVVLFFYPAAMTKGCTAESCHFRDLGAAFGELSAQRLGISVDPVDRQHRFATTYGLDFPLLSDADGAVARAYGVKRRFGPIPVKRWTFVIAASARILGVVKSELAMAAHADRALELLRQGT